jgi:hypothetical protein
MFRALTSAALIAVVTGAAAGQALGVLHVKITLADAARTPTPIARHTLLISDNPPSRSPRRIFTKADGTADVELRPGNYTVESDAPVAFGGRGYQWTQTVDVMAGREVVLELTAANAEVGDAPAPSLSSEPVESDRSPLLPLWRDSVVAVWTPESRASGFIIDPAGLVVTSQRAIGNPSAVEVQLSPSVKVAARVLAADRLRGVAVLLIDPGAAASVRPIPLDCDAATKTTLARAQKVVAIGAPLRGQKEASAGDVLRVSTNAIQADFILATGSAGGPVFSAGGSVVGLASEFVDEDPRGSGGRIMPVADICSVVGSVGKATLTSERPAATRLPVEPLRPFPSDALDAVVKQRAGSLNAYQMTSADFDVAFLTPVIISGARHNLQQADSGGRDAQPRARVVATDFGDWSEYFADVPPVLVIRVTPKLAEGFWTSIARGAAYTQGVALPSIKHFKPGFSRLRVLCGDEEVTPIHPFTLEQRVSETDAVREGLYVFDPSALGPHCKSVKLVVYSEKAPDKPDTRAVDAQVIERIWQDFAPFR